MVLAMGMLSLSAITVRKSGRDGARQEAEANARMALMFAIAEIQQHLGPDQRVSGDARIVTRGKSHPTNPNWVSVWKTSRDDGSPWVRRDGGSGGLRDLRGENRNPGNERIALLVSGNERAIKYEEEVRLDDENSAILVGRKSIGEDAEEDEMVRAPLVTIKDHIRERGRYAWWVGDLGTKANVATRDPSSERSSSEDYAMMLAQDSSWEAFGKSDIPSEARAGLVSDRQLAIFDNNLKDRNFHDYTVWSSGLPINVRDGGWKRDMTAFLVSDGSVASYRGEGANLPGLDDTDSMVGSANDAADNQSWDPGQSSRLTFVAPKYGLLRKWAERATYSPPGAYSPPTEIGDTTGGDSNFTGELSVGNSKRVVEFRNQTQSKLMPILAEGSIYYNLSYYSVDNLNNPYGLRVHYYPRVVLWNPYNFPLQVPDSGVGLFINGSKSVELTLTGGEKRLYRMNWGRGGAQRGSMYFRMSGTTLGPGESVMWTPATNRRYNESSYGQNLLSPSVSPSPARSFFQDTRSDSVALFKLENIDDPDLKLANNRTNLPPIDWREVVPRTSADNLQAAMYTQADDYYMTWKPLSASNFTYATFSDFPMGRFISCAYQYGDEDEMPVEWTSADPVPFPAMSGPDGVVNTIPDRRTRDGFRFRWSQETESNIIGSGTLAGTPHLEDAPMANWNVRASYSFRNPFDNVTDVAPNFFGIYTRDLFDTEVDWNNMNPRAEDGKFMGDPFEQPIQAPRRRILFDVPRAGTEIASLGAFQHAALSEMVWHPTYAVGNSLVDPRVPQDRTEPDRSEGINRDKGGWNQDSIGYSVIDGRSNTNQENATTNEDNWAFHARRLLQNAAFDYNLIYDLSYEVNETLWDPYFLSSGTPSQKKMFLQNPFENPLPNGRIMPNRMGPPIEDDDLLDFHLAASRLVVDGAFNVNSTSVEAWESLLLSNLGVKYNNKVAFPRFLNPQDGTWNGDDPTAPGAWSGQRVFSKDEIRRLAEEIVKQVELRGPFLSMADFVNRRLAMGQMGKKGALQAAIDESGVNKSFEQEWPLNNQQSLPDYEHPDNIRDATRMEQTSKPATTAWGALGFLTQADLLQFLAPALTVRSDTFKVRAYGESLDQYGKVVARAWCEAVVQRTPHYFDSNEGMMTLPGDLNKTNERFGRRFRMISFRWLKPSEI